MLSCPPVIITIPDSAGGRTLGLDAYCIPAGAHRPIAAMTHAAQDHNEAVILSRLGFGSVQPAIHQMRDRAEENTIRLFDANRMELVSMLPEAEPPALRSAPRPASRLTQPIISPSRPSSLPDLSSPESASKSLNRLRVLFLDIDGVICCDEHAALDPAKLQQLARIADTTGCKVCLSSNWRFYDDLREYVYQQLDVLGIARIGTTPDAGEAESGEPKRPCEISAWMRAWNQGRRPKVQSFVAVDDRPLTEETGGAFLKGVHPDAHSIFHVSKPFALVWQVISSRPTRRPD